MGEQHTLTVKVILGDAEVVAAALSAAYRACAASGSDLPDALDDLRCALLDVEDTDVYAEIEE